MPREHILSPHRLLLLGLIALLALVALAAVRGPDWYRRIYYPLKYEKIIGDAAKAAQVDPYLLTALVHAESDFKPDSVSKRGAVGLTQVMPETARDILEARHESITKVTPEKLKDPKFNTEIGADYLAQLDERYDGDTALALAAYNAGVLNADKWRKRSGKSVDRIGFPATKHYVSKVLKERETYKRLYPEAYPWQKR
jgi:soluble lytic murein transglycosylase